MVYLFKTFGIQYQFNLLFGFNVVSDAIITLHHDIMTYLILIIVSIIYLVIRILLFFTHFNKPLWSYSYSFPLHISINNLNQSFNGRYYTTETVLEIIWTVIPMVLLIFIGLLTMSFIYNLCNYIYFPNYTISVTGHQWYWSYTYNEYNLMLESYLINEDYLDLGELRLLEVDNRLIIPSRSHIRIMVTSDDVIHSWAVPLLGIKIDANPGRMNHCHLFILNTSTFYGQCSELCGTGHGFMPIAVQSVPTWIFKLILNNFLQNNNI